MNRNSYGSDRDTPQKMSVWTDENSDKHETDVRISLHSPRETGESDFKENSKTLLSNKIKPLYIDSFVDDINEFADSDQYTRSPKTNSARRSPSAKGRMAAKFSPRR